MTKHQYFQRVMRQYRDDTGKREIDMKEVARWAVRNGMDLPDPESPFDRIAKEFARAAREEIRRDKKTGQPYRANHAFTDPNGQGSLWIDIDEAPRPYMHKSLLQRREQMVGDGLQLSLDMDHWNSINPGDQPIELPLDFTEDVEWRKNAPAESKRRAG